MWSCFFFFKQKTAYEMRISDWSSDVCSSDLPELLLPEESMRSHIQLLDEEELTGDAAFQSTLFGSAKTTRRMNSPKPAAPPAVPRQAQPRKRDRKSVV